MRKILCLALSLFLLVAAASCSSSDSDGASPKGTTTRPKKTPPKTPAAKATEDDYLKALDAGFTAGDPKQGQLQFSQDESDCLTPKWLKILDVDRLKTKGLDPRDLSKPDFNYGQLGMKKADAEALVKAAKGCGADLGARSLANIAANLPDSVKPCFEKQFTAADALSLVTQVLYLGKPDAAFTNRLTSIGQACGLDLGGDTSGGAAGGGGAATASTLPPVGTVPPEVPPTTGG